MAGSKVPEGNTAAAVLEANLAELTPSTDLSWLDRTDDRNRLAAHGIPRPRTEAWKYSNVERLYERLNSVDRGCATVDIAPTTNGPVVQNFQSLDASGRSLVTAHAGHHLDPGRYPLAAVCRLLMDSALLIFVPRETRAQVDLPDGNAVQYVLVIVEDGATLELSESRGAAMRTIECSIGANAELCLDSVSAATTEREYRLVAATLERDACFQYRQYGNGGEFRRNDIYVGLDGPGAAADLRGAWLLTERQHLDTQVAVHHNAPRCRSRQLFRGVATDRATAAFLGRIYIAPGADGADASLSNKNLLQSTSAATFTKPELEIHAHDVSCAHGATIGQLDNEALYYLRARGIDTQVATRMLIKGFLDQAVTGNLAEAARATLELRP